MKVRVHNLKNANKIFNDLSKDIESIINNNTIIKDEENGGKLMELFDFEIATINSVPYLILRYEEKYKGCEV